VSNCRKDRKNYFFLTRNQNFLIFHMRQAKIDDTLPNKTLYFEFTHISCLLVSHRCNRFKPGHYNVWKSSLLVSEHLINSWANNFQSLICWIENLLWCGQKQKWANSDTSHFQFQLVFVGQLAILPVPNSGTQRF
jgi:hypothetical protein